MQKKTLNINTNELEQWVGLCIYSPISKLSNARQHWSLQLGALRDFAAEVMSRNRWEDIKHKRHLVDNTSLTNKSPYHHINHHKLFKIRPMVDHLREKFQAILKMQNLCVDEQMVPFKSKCSIKQYIPSKPHKWGYKLMVLANSQGMTYDFFLYTGKINPMNNPLVPDLEHFKNTCQSWCSDSFTASYLPGCQMAHEW